MTIPCLQFSVSTLRRDLKGHENPMEVSIQLRSTNKQTDNANKVTNPELFKKLGEKNLSQVKSTHNLFYIMTWMKICAKPQMTKFKNLSYVSQCCDVFNDTIHKAIGTLGSEYVFGKSYSK